MIEQNERVHEMILKATDALLDWLDEGWIEADGAWNVDRARIHIYRDWYAPYWTVAFTVEGPALVRRYDQCGRGRVEFRPL